MKQKMVTAKCFECGKEWLEKYTWYGQSEMCSDCVKERTLKNNCKRHLGRDGKDCYPCQLEGRFP